MRTQFFKKNFLIAFFVAISFCSNAADYLQIRFSSFAKIPSATLDHGYFILDCNDRDLTDLFANYAINSFEREYPLADSFSGNTIDTLKRVYKVRVDYGLASLYSAIVALNSGDVDNVYLMDNSPTSLFEPNDYYNCFACNGGTWPTASMHLDLINAKAAWDLSRGLSCIKIGISDINFEHHTDIDANLITTPANPANIATAGTYGNSHGVEVAGTAAGQSNNNAGLASLGYGVKLRYYDLGYPSFLQAVLDGVKVINCSWYSAAGSSLSIGNANEQTLINFVYNQGITIVAAAGNNNTGTLTDYFFPASYNHVISVTSVGSQWEVGTYIPSSTPSGGIAANWKDTHRQFSNPNDTRYNNMHNHNSMVDICAPGYYLEVHGANNSTRLNGGTSLAAPQVSAAAALLYSLNPNFTPTQVENYLKNSAANIYSIADNSTFTGQLGAGRLDAGAALASASSSACQTAFTGLSWEGSSNNGATYTSIAPKDFWQYGKVRLTTTTSQGSGNNVYWEIKYNGVYTPTGTSNSVVLDFGTNLQDLTIYRGPKHCIFPIEIYVRQESNSCCVSPFYSEVIYAADPDCITYKASYTDANAAQALLDKKIGIKLYPSPAKSSINVVINNSKSVITNYKIFSIDGKSIKQGKISGNNAVLNIGDLNKGIYLFKTKDGSVKFIKE